MTLALYFIALCLSVREAAASGDTRWAVFTPEVIFYQEDAPGAGVVYPDRHALIYYISEHDGWLATLTLSTPAVVTSVTSRLVRKDGLSASLILDENKMISAYDHETRRATISFAFAAEDIERFQSAIEWLVETEFGTVSFSLSGSHAALKQLLQVTSGT
ncbi:hypothetical protein CFI11_18410 [Thalassococcus sp. S3]|nr:hypothetical protein CFI11_18410 [Thalassococcus sp. S3]